MNYLVKIEDHWIRDTSIHELLTSGDPLTQDDIEASMSRSDFSWVMALIWLMKPLQESWIDDVIKTSMSRLNSSFVIALIWLMEKSGLAEVKLNKRKKIVKAYEPLGHLLYSLLELCIHTYSLTEHSKHYGSPYIWFLYVFHDVLRESILSYYKQSSQTQIIKCQREHIEQLKNYQNPFSYQRHHLRNLIDSAILLARSSPTWDKKWFRGNQKDPQSLGFLAAYKRVLHHMERKDIRIPFLTDQGIRYYTKGRESRKLPIAESTAIKPLQAFK